MDRTFLTRQTKQKSSFEQKYNERFGGGVERHPGLPGLSPQLIQKKLEMEKTNGQLEDARNRFETWKANFQRKKKELDDKQAALDEQRANLDKFSRHHTLELEKAKKREADELEQAKRIETELEQLTSQESELSKKNESLKKELEELQPYADYLQSVVDNSHSFESIESILHRQEALTTTRDEYVRRYKELLTHFGTEEEQLAQQLESRKNQFIDYTMKLNDGKAKANQAKKLSEYKKTTLFKDIQRIEDKHVELTQIKSAIKAIYDRAVEKAGGHVARSSAPSEEAMLQFIENRFTDLNDVLNDPQIQWKAPPTQTK